MLDFCPLGQQVKQGIVSRIARVAGPVTVGIGLIGVGGCRAVIRAVGHTITIAVGQRITGIAEAVTICISLVGIGHQRAVVAAIGQTVFVVVAVIGGVVAVLRAGLESDPPDRWLERLRLLWLPEVAAAARYLGRFRVGRLERFFEQPSVVIRLPIDHFLGGRAHVQKPRVGVLQPAVVSEDTALARASQIQPHTFRLDRTRLLEYARRRLLGSRVGDLYYGIYRWL